MLNAAEVEARLIEADQDLLQFVRLEPGEIGFVVHGDNSAVRPQTALPTALQRSRSGAAGARREPQLYYAHAPLASVGGKEPIVSRLLLARAVV